MRFLLVKEIEVDEEALIAWVSLPELAVVEADHRDLAYTDKVLADPHRVIAETWVLSRQSDKDSKFPFYCALASAYYGQVSHLIAGKQYVIAFIFFKKAWHYAELALGNAKREGEIGRAHV